MPDGIVYLIDDNGLCHFYRQILIEDIQPIKNNYLTKSDASNIYLQKSNANNYLEKNLAANTYLKIEDAKDLYEPLGAAAKLTYNHNTFMLELKPKLLNLQDFNIYINQYENIETFLNENKYYLFKNEEYISLKNNTTEIYDWVENQNFNLYYTKHLGLNINIYICQSGITEDGSEGSVSYQLISDNVNNIYESWLENPNINIQDTYPNSNGLLYYNTITNTFATNDKVNVLTQTMYDQNTNFQNQLSITGNLAKNAGYKIHQDEEKYNKIFNTINYYKLSIINNISEYKKETNPTIENLSELYTKTASEEQVAYLLEEINNLKVRIEELEKQ